MIKRSISGIIFVSIIIVVALTACAGKKDHKAAKQSEDITIVKPANSYIPVAGDKKMIASETDQPDSLVAFAKTLIGIPYLYACTDPQKGFDCSGFVTYVFNHFNIAVPRSSVDFTTYGKEIGLEKARPGDLILFTGTDSSDLIVGHMGIVESIKDDTLRFIHSTSGKAKGVVISPLSEHYKKRFVKVIRVFRD
ncbi:MAG TPA: C40 family peptidase [Chitinophagaceae bacterium]|nr:C40 family peptidase [Chitinophagaceae bacterium]